MKIFFKTFLKNRLYFLYETKKLFNFLPYVSWKHATKMHSVDKSYFLCFVLFSSFSIAFSLAKFAGVMNQHCFLFLLFLVVVVSIFLYRNVMERGKSKNKSIKENVGTSNKMFLYLFGILKFPLTQNSF